MESSALYAPFAFANGRVSNLVLDEEFGFKHGGRSYALSGVQEKQTA